MDFIEDCAEGVEDGGGVLVIGLGIRDWKGIRDYGVGISNRKK